MLSFFVGASSMCFVCLLGNPVVFGSDKDKGGRRLIGAQEFKAAESCDHASGLQPGQQSKTLSQKKKKTLGGRDGRITRSGDRDHPG